MCDGISEIALVVGATAAVGGAVTSYVAGSNAASAARTAQSQAAQAQNQAFMARMSAQQQQTQEQAAANTAAQQRFSAIQQQQQDAQSSAMDARQAVIDRANQQEQAISQQHDQAVQQAVDQTTPQALQQAQTQQYQAQQALNAPNVQEAAANNPLGASAVGAVKDALEKGQAGAAASVKQYGDSLAKLSSYSAPIETANLAATNLGTNLMPAAVAQNLVQTSTPALLMPSTVAYQNAGVYGQALQNASQMVQQNQLALANTKAQNAIDLANLGQSDTDAMLQGELNVKQADAAKLAALGQGVSSVGNVALQYGAMNGGLSSLFSSAKVPTVPASQVGAWGRLAGPT